ncbi:MAG: protein arginine kinase [Candidatus Sumerlaeia bacterium]|nr:protein arginine kinase [Candidatus Sumerlaeia bacterium]
MDIVSLTENWAEPPGPSAHVVVSSRVRLARNLERIIFPSHADTKDLRQVCDAVDRLVRNETALREFERIDISACRAVERMFLRENHIISPELEQSSEFRVLHLNPKRSCAIMVNEEDHLRMYCLRSGLQLTPALEEINAVDAVVGRSLRYAYSEKYGFLTACPSNVGTGMRASVMLHLPGLVMTRQIEEIIKVIPHRGLAARGYYGENSEFLGDFYQISNEVTLGKTDTEIIEELQSFIEGLVSREEAARASLLEKKHWQVEDVIWRAYGVLTHARIMSSKEAFQLLSPIRLGIERGHFPPLTHHRLNRFIVAMQPGHLQIAEGKEMTALERGIARARFLRSVFSELKTTN